MSNLPSSRSVMITGDESPSRRFQSMALLGALAAAMAGPFVGAANLVSRPFEGMRYSPRSRTTKADRDRITSYQQHGKRKLLRTTRATTEQGRSLQAHFDAHRLTRSQMKKFYAGKQL